MAKDSTSDLLKQRLKEVAAEKERQEGALSKLQDRLRGNPGDLALRAKVNEAKVGIGKVSDEYGDLARAVSSMQGGTNHVPPVTG